MNNESPSCQGFTATAWPPHSRRTRRAGFSLGEVVLALGIVSFALVAVLGLMPAGLNASRRAIDISVGSQVVQRINEELQQTDFDSLTAPGALPDRYFDDEGQEVVPAKSIYSVRTEVLKTDGQVATALPTTATTSALATVVCKLGYNPEGARNLNTLFDDPKSYREYAVYIAKNR
jgi:uncharacterized protein (TIGR02598 family)